MAWTAPRTWVAGEVATAANFNTHLRDNLLAGGPIFADQTARDAAIPSPFEGQRCYLTAPTTAEVNATGAVPFIPAGIAQIYSSSGPGWVTITPVSSANATNGTTTSTSSSNTTWTGLTGAVPAVVTRTGTTALVSLSCMIGNNTSAVASNVGCIVTTGSVVAPAHGFLSSQNTANYLVRCGTTFVMSGLTAGVNTFTMTCWVTSNTGSFYYPAITVAGIA